MKNILFLGCGKMGAIIAQNLIKEKSFQPSEISVLKPTSCTQISNIFHAKSASELPENYHADIVFICIKPQESEQILQNFANEKIYHQNTIFISILAGKKIAFFEKIFGKKAKIIRSMPNLPIENSQGIFTFLANKNINDLELLNLEKIFTKFGATLALKDENLFDVATAIFGSGPAYIFLLQEIFSKIAQENQITQKQSEELVKTLFLGSSLMSRNSNFNFTQLRNSVTSKGGTTEAAINILQQNSRLEKIFNKAIRAAKNKSKILSKDD